MKTGDIAVQTAIENGIVVEFVGENSGTAMATATATYFHVNSREPV